MAFNVTIPGGGQTSGGVTVNADGSRTMLNSDGSITTTHPDGSITVERGKIESVQTTDPITGKPVTVQFIIGSDGSRQPNLSDPATKAAFDNFDAKTKSDLKNGPGTPLLPSASASWDTTGKGAAGTLGTVLAPYLPIARGDASYQTTGFGGAKTVIQNANKIDLKSGTGWNTNTGTPAPSGGGSGGSSGSGTTAGALAAAAALRDKFSAAYDTAVPGVAPVITAAQAKDPTLATYLAQKPVTTATAGQVGAIPQVVAPTIGQAPTVQAGTATAGLATPATTINVTNAQAAQAKAEQLDPAQQAEWRAQQKTLAGYLNDAILGNAPSVAELQLREAEQRQEANQLGLAAKASGGGNLALALRTAANNMGRLNQGSSADAALLRAQEIATARGQMGDVLSSARTGDINIADRNATLATGVNQTNAGLTTDVSKLNASNATDASKTLAQLLTQTNISNAGNQTQASVANAGNQTQASAATAQNITQLLAKKAELEYQASHDNAGNALSAAETQAKLATDVNLANALAQNNSDLQNQKLSADVSQTNANNSTSTNINNAKFVNDAAKANADNTLTQAQLDAKIKQDAAGNALDASRTVVNGNTGLIDATTRKDQADWNKDKDIAQGIGAGIAVLSDRRAKTDVSDGEAAAQSILDAMTPKTFRYKDGARGAGVSPGKKTGVMAQDLERSPAGRPLVMDTPRGKMIDSAGSTGTLMAMLATLNKRLDRVEGRHA